MQLGLGLLLRDNGALNAPDAVRLYVVVLANGGSQLVYLYCNQHKKYHGHKNH